MRRSAPEAPPARKAAPVKNPGAPPDRKFRSLGALNRALMEAPPFASSGGRIVLGNGPAGAAIAFVGEQPGDQEDQQGLSFVGPAGKFLDAALIEAGIDRKQCYVTNAVKQFNFIQRGKKRLHQRPRNDDILYYRRWLELELGLVAPAVIVALGSTALFALSGRRLSVSGHRGPLTLLGRKGYVTVHPSAILRIPDRDARHQARDDFVADLKKIRAMSRSAANERDPAP